MEGREVLWLPKGLHLPCPLRQVAFQVYSSSMQAAGGNSSCCALNAAHFQPLSSFLFPFLFSLVDYSTYSQAAAQQG